jgi:hypothetical protein
MAANGRKIYAVSKSVDRKHVTFPHTNVYRKQESILTNAAPLFEIDINLFVVSSFFSVVIFIYSPFTRYLSKEFYTLPELLFQVKVCWFYQIIVSFISHTCRRYRIVNYLKLQFCKPYLSCLRK